MKSIDNAVFWFIGGALTFAALFMGYARHEIVAILMQLLALVAFVTGFIRMKQDDVTPSAQLDEAVGKIDRNK